MEESEFNPISGEQVAEPESIDSSKTAQSSQQLAPPVQPGERRSDLKEQIIVKKVNNLKKSIFILGGLLVIVLIVLVLVLATIARQNQVGPDITPSPIPTATPQVVENRNVPQEISDRVKTLEDKVNNLDIEENELSFPKLDWNIKY